MPNPSPSLPLSLSRVTHRSRPLTANKHSFLKGEKKKQDQKNQKKKKKEKKDAHITHFSWMKCYREH